MGWGRAWQDHVGSEATWVLLPCWLPTSAHMLMWQVRVAGEGAVGYGWDVLTQPYPPSLRR